MWYTNKHLSAILSARYNYIKKIVVINVLEENIVTLVNINI